MNLKAPNIVGFEALLRGRKPFVNGELAIVRDESRRIYQSNARFEKPRDPTPPWLAGE